MAIILFKNISEIKEFRTGFIQESEFKVLSELEMQISDRDISQADKTGFLKLSNLKIPTDYFEIQNLTGRSTTQQEIVEEVNEKYVYVEEMVDIILTGIELNKNVLLWGPGGHAKSEVVMITLQKALEKKLISSPPFIKAFGDGLTEEKLLGGLDIKLLKDRGVIYYLVENSFLKHEIVVFEEIFDAPAASLLKLKDILTSGYLREGDQYEKCYTKTIIGITNKDKAEFSKNDDSVKALVDRFPLTLQVKWPDYTAKRFITMFQTVLGNSTYEKHKSQLNQLADILYNNNINSGSFVSPRTALVAAQLIMKNKDLKLISEIDPNILKKYVIEKRKESQLQPQTQMITNIESYINNYDLTDLGADSTSFEAINALAAAVGSEKLDFSGYVADESQSYESKLNRALFLKEVLNRTNIIKEVETSVTNMNKRLTSITDMLKKKTEIKNGNN